MTNKDIIFYFPSNSAENEYMNNQVDIFRAITKNVYPLKKILNFKYLFSRNRNIIVLNWFEDIFSDKCSLSKVLLGIGLLIFLKISSKKIIYVRHNLNPHSNKNIKCFIFFQKALQLFSSNVITHRGIGENNFVIPHPYYKNKNNLSHKNRDINYLCFGRIQRYKGIETLLSNWPENEKLLILGFCDDNQLELEIERIINDRSLDVVWVNKRIDKDELDNYLSRTKFVIIPYVDNSMIVSGVFYHSISFGCNIIMRESKYAHYCMKNYENIYEFNYNNMNIKLDYKENEKLEEQYIHQYSVILKKWKEVINE
ncbi:hypothetical protein EQ875_03842 [Photobacterium damselae subsp. damselae]|uniref:hypothetical protein n=1 Tax=Photobacterium damselae TaxID=38293 RepID=UPI00109BF2C6|nr:hypothetical protein [Photobacterium damselae]TGZ32607.1 hypothetical protein EQ875_03842 [Photobacterium damselae subsp. damselae]